MSLQARVIAALAALLVLILTHAGAAWWGYSAGAHANDAKQAKATVSAQSVVIGAQAGVIAGNQAKDDKAAKADENAQIKTQALNTDAARLAAERDRLRDTLAAVRADALRETTTRARLAAQVGALTDSLGECGREYSAMAGERDSLAIQVAGLLELAP